MGGEHHRGPLRRPDLVGAEVLPNPIVEDLCGRPGQRPQSFVAQAGEERTNVDTQCLGALPHLEGRESVDVDARDRLLDRGDDLGMAMAKTWKTQIHRSN